MRKKSIAFFVALLLIALGCGDKKFFVTRNGGDTMPPVVQTAENYCMPALAKSFALWWPIPGLKDMTQSEIMDNFDTFHDGFLDIGELGTGIGNYSVPTHVGGAATFTDLEAVWKSYIKDRDLPIVVLLQTSNPNIGHGVAVVGLAEKDNGSTAGYYQVNPSYNGITYTDKSTFYYRMIPTAGSNYFLVLGTFNAPSLQPTKEVPAYWKHPNGPAIENTLNEIGVYQPDDPLEKIAIQGLSDAQIDEVMGPQGDYKRWYRDYYSDLSFDPSFPIHMVVESSEVGNCPRVMDYVLPVKDNKTNELRGTVVIVDSALADEAGHCNGVHHITTTEFLILFPTPPENNLVVRSPVLWKDVQKELDENPNPHYYTTRAVFGPNDLGYVSPVLPFTEVKDVNGNVVETVGPYGENIVWDGSKYTLSTTTTTLEKEDFSVSSFPNPFNPTTSIKFSLPQAAIVTVEIYNVLGQKMKTLLQTELLTAGTHSITFNSSDGNNSLPSGVYFYNIKAGTMQKTGKIVLLK